jgi:hypothetical protein
MARSEAFRPARTAGPWLLLLVLASCATSPPEHPNDVCAIFEEKDDWYAAARKAQRRWGVPVAVQMAIINRESSFVDDARPPFEWFGPIPLGRPTTAYGYSQATDPTWERYLKSSGNGGADRDDFGDAADFVGWYAHQSYTQLGIHKHDAYRQYLAYHEGQGGYRRGTYRKKVWLLKAARSVDATAGRYRRQLAGCQAALDASVDSDD